ncbi:MAG TPA: hypothetical protein VHD87_05600 [Acidimicrobiales bacterium]|nr:hypothetical protein [Acidimicrobiales bacterium]
MTGILDIPDEPPRVWRGVPAAAISAAACVVAGTVLARTFAVGGLQHARLALGLCVPVPAAIAAWLLAGAHAWRTAVTAVAMVVGIAFMPLASHGATPSPARLSALADHLGLPGVKVHEVRIGNGRCRPSCSEVRRVSTAKGSSFVKTAAELQAALRVRGFTVKLFAHAVGAPTVISAESSRITAEFELRPVDLDVTRIAGTFIAKGPTPAHSVG